MLEPEILEARPAEEFVVRPQNEVGLLHEVSKVIGERGVNIIATANWVTGDTAVLRFLTDD
ncbi:MAG: hypothetical protein ABEI54_00970, partial [Candidatus Bipolaricaulia bacterium]